MKRVTKVIAKKEKAKKRIQSKRADIRSAEMFHEVKLAASVLPKMTIVTPSFNQGKFIERTINSVVSQNYPYLEYIVVDGGSTDETLDILKKHENRLRWISERDTGQSNAINKGFRMARGEIVAWLNSDDIYLPDALVKVGRHFADHPDVIMVYGEGNIIDEHDAIKSRFPFTERKFDLWKLIYFSDYILQQSTFFRRSVFDSIDMLSESLHYTMDWDLFIRIGKRFRVDYIPEYIGCIREHVEAKTSTGGKIRFHEIRALIRQHGKMRYSLAYFNYAWDLYGKKWFPGDAASNGNKRKNGLPAMIRRILEYFFAWYQKRLQQGYYSDNWVGRKAMIVLPDYTPEVRKSSLIIEGEAARPIVPFQLKVIVNRNVRGAFRIVSPGRFEVKLELPETLNHDGCFHVEMKSNRTFVPSRLGTSRDDRALAFQLKEIKVLSRELIEA